MTMEQQFNSYMESADMSALVSLCEREGTPVTYEKGDYLLHAGSVEPYIYLIRSGYCRLVSTKSDGAESVVGLALAGEFVCEFYNGIRRRPSGLSVIASSRLEALRLPFVYALDTVSASHPMFLPQVMEGLYRMCYERLIDLYELTPAERYLKFSESYPGLVSQIRLNELASYLGITPQHLLRIKKSKMKG